MSQSQFFEGKPEAPEVQLTGRAVEYIVEMIQRFDLGGTEGAAKVPHICFPLRQFDPARPEVFIDKTANGGLLVVLGSMPRDRLNGERLIQIGAYQCAVRIDARFTTCESIEIGFDEDLFASTK